MSLPDIDTCNVLKKAVTLAKGDRQTLVSAACGLAGCTDCTPDPNATCQSCCKTVDPLGAVPTVGPALQSYCLNRFDDCDKLTGESVCSLGTADDDARDRPLAKLMGDLVGIEKTKSGKCLFDKNGNCKSDMSVWLSLFSVFISIILAIALMFK